MAPSSASHRRFHTPTSSLGSTWRSVFCATSPGTGFAALALLLACIGLYGVLAYITSWRVPEIGVRMALGASAGEVMKMVLRQSLRMVLIGLGVGVVGALAAAQILEHFVAGVRAAEPATFALMICTLLAAALLAGFVPARRASRIDPLTALEKHRAADR